MKKAVLIAEKNSLLKSIMSAYNNNRSQFDFTIDGFAQAGHLFGLKNPKEMDEDMGKWEMTNYPWHPKSWQYKITEGSEDKKYKRTKADIYRSIRDAINSGEYDFVIHAGDPDQEGELLIRETLQEADNRLPVKRIWINASTEEEYLNGLLNLEDDSDPFYENMNEAALARQHADYLVGMNFSPVVSLKSNETCNIGRLKTFIVHMVAKREEEVNEWKPSSTYTVVADYKEGFSGTHTEYFPTPEEAENLIKNLGNTAKVVSAETKRERLYAPSFFKLSTLQIDASGRGFSAEEIQDIAQSLYDKGFLSYPRTSCEFLNDKADFERMLNSASVFDELKPFIRRISREDIESIKTKKAYVRNKEVAESGHMALTPTTKVPNLSSLSSEEYEVLLMVFSRFVAAFLPPLVQDKTKIITENNGYEFVSTGKVLIDKGFTELLLVDMKDKVLPAVEEGATVNTDGFSVAEKKAVPPKLFTEGTLIKALESPSKYIEDEHLRSVGKTLEVSIGQPSTRAPMIKQLLALKYIERKKGSSKAAQLVATEKGKRIYKNMQGNSLTRADMTAAWEEKLEGIRKGTYSREEFEKEIWNYVVSEVEILKKKDMVRFFGGSAGDSLGECPKCKSAVKKGKFGIFCTGKCGMNLAKVYGHELTESQIKKLMDGKSVSYTDKGKKTTVLPEVIPNEWKGKTYYNWKTSR